MSPSRTGDFGVTERRVRGASRFDKLKALSRSKGSHKPESAHRSRVAEPFRQAQGPEHVEGLRPPFEVRWLGRVDFGEALELQEKIVAQKRNDPAVADTILLLEHDPVYTIGRTPDQSSLRGGSHLPHPSFQINRGGQATYHGPGQLMGYPIIDLRRCGQDLHKYLRWIESLLIEFLGEFGIEAQRREGLTGVWVQERKIVSIGVGVRQWITMHGFALNVGGDLSPFDQITPCGISNVAMTSMEKETGKSISVHDAAVAFAKLVRRGIGELRANVR